MYNHPYEAWVASNACKSDIKSLNHPLFIHLLRTLENFDSEVRALLLDQPSKFRSALHKVSDEPVAKVEEREWAEVEKAAWIDIDRILLHYVC